MKKIAILPVLALAFMAACSDKDEPQFPNYPVVSVPAVVDQVIINLPVQNADYESVAALGSACYNFTYDNNQEIVYEIKTDLPNTSAFVRKIGGTCSNVIIPPYLTATMNGEVTQIPVVGLDLVVDAAPENVQTLTICGDVHYMVLNAALVSATSDYIRTQVSKLNYVTKIELESTYPDYVSVDGNIYTSDLAELVAVPLGKSGLFTVADGTAKIQDRALFGTRFDAVTIPASVKEIGHEALVNMDKLMLVNILSEEAPTAYDNSFGYYAYNGVLRIPANSKANYSFEKPDLVKPVAPPMVDPDASDEEWDEYERLYEQYEEDLANYNQAMSQYTNHAAFSLFKDIEEVSFK